MPVDEAERTRRRRLVRAHLATENAHDLDAIMDTFSPAPEMVFNGVSYPTREIIATAHAGFGMSGAVEGALDDLKTIELRDYITDDEIIIEGTLEGTHVREFFGFPPSGKRLRMAYLAIYRFDAAGKLENERIVMDFSKFALPD